LDNELENMRREIIDEYIKPEIDSLLDFKNKVENAETIDELTAMIVEERNRAIELIEGYDEEESV